VAAVPLTTWFATLLVRPTRDVRIRNGESETGG
jgi:hypothetical protein